MVVTTTKAAEMLGVTRQRIVQLITDGKLQAHKVGRDWLIRSESVEALMAVPRYGVKS